MRIAQVSPLYESVPPSVYGGTERVVSYLTEELVRQGHDVTLFASGDSSTSATLSPQCDRALRLDESCSDSLAYHISMLGEVFNRAEEFDVIHFHVDYLHFPLSRQIRVPNVTTLHGRLDLPEHAHIYSQFSDIPVISISNSQRQPVAFANWIATVYHGLPSDLYKLDPAPGRYLAFIGRFSPEKRADRAIEIAKQLGMPLRIAAKIDKADKEYFEQTMKPMLDHPLVEYVGEIGESEKQEFLGGAQALLFPIDWPEPFGLVLIEAMACGTPVIAFRRGSVPEIIEDGLTGFIVDSMDEAVAAVRKVDNLSRAACRCEFEKRFTASRMAGDYLDEYVQLQTRESPVLTRMCT